MTEVQQPKPPEVVETSAGVLSRVGPPDDVLKLVQLRDLVGFDSVGSLPWVRSTKLFRARDSESKSKFVNSLGLMASYRNREKGFELWLEESGFVRLIESEFVHVMGEGFFDDLRKVFKGECDTRVIVAENISRTVSAVNMLNNLLSSIPGDATALKSSARFLRSLVADESFSKDDKRYLCEMVWDALSSMKSAGEPAVAGGECDVMLLEAGKFVVSHLVQGVVDSAYPFNPRVVGGRRDIVLSGISKKMDSANIDQLSSWVNGVKKLTPFGSDLSPDEGGGFISKTLGVGLPVLTSKVMVVYSTTEKPEEVSRIEGMSRRKLQEAKPTVDEVVVKPYLVHSVSESKKFTAELDRCVTAGDVSGIGVLLKGIEKKFDSDYYRERRGGKNFLDEFEFTLERVDKALCDIEGRGVLAPLSVHQALFDLKCDVREERLLESEGCGTLMACFSKMCLRAPKAEVEVVNAILGGVSKLCSTVKEFKEEEVYFMLCSSGSDTRAKLLDRVRRVLSVNGGRLIPEIVRRTVVFDVMNEEAVNLITSGSSPHTGFWSWVSLEYPGLFEMRGRFSSALEGLSEREWRFALYVLARAREGPFAGRFLECLEDPSKLPQSHGDKKRVISFFSHLPSRERSCFLIDNLSWEECQRLFSSTYDMNSEDLVRLNQISGRLDSPRNFPSEAELAMFHDIVKCGLTRPQEENVAASCLGPYIELADDYDVISRRFDAMLDPEAKNFVGDLFLLYMDGIRFHRRFKELTDMPVDGSVNPEFYSLDEIKAYRRARELVDSGKSRLTEEQLARVRLHEDRMLKMYRVCADLFVGLPTETLGLIYPDHKKPVEYLEAGGVWWEGFFDHPYHPKWELDVK